MESFAHYFNKHIAKKIELDDITIIDYHSPEYNLMYNLRYIFDKKNSSLAITGDFGELIAVNFNNMGSWEDFYKDFTNNAGYFIEKIKASSRNLFVYDEAEAKKIILDYFFDNKRYEDLDENDRYYFDELFEYFDDRHGFKHITDTVREFLSEQDSEYYETLEFAGKKVSEIVFLYLDAYKRAYESIKNEEVE